MVVKGGRLAAAPIILSDNLASTVLWKCPLQQPFNCTHIHNMNPSWKAAESSFEHPFPLKHTFHLIFLRFLVHLFLPSSYSPKNRNTRSSSLLQKKSTLTLCLFILHSKQSHTERQLCRDFLSFSLLAIRPLIRMKLTQFLVVRLLNLLRERKVRVFRAGIHSDAIVIVRLKSNSPVDSVKKYHVISRVSWQNSWKILSLSSFNSLNVRKAIDRLNEPHAVRY